jgi:hypothetical protein
LPLDHDAVHRADFVREDDVMTTHGAGPLRRAFLGSTADAFVQCSTTPVLLIRPQEASAEFGRELTLSRLLVPPDGSFLAEQILGPAASG